MENNSNITTNIIEAINTILNTLFSSIDNNVYSVLDDITFINSDIITDSYFEKILGNDFEIENLFSTNDQLKFGLNNEDYEEHKYNYSYNTYNKILLQEDTYDETTIKNFEKVIEKLITEIVGD